MSKVVSSSGTTCENPAAPATKSDSDLCWQKVIQINLEARQQVCTVGGGGYRVTSGRIKVLGSLFQVCARINW